MKTVSSRPSSKAHANGGMPTNSSVSRRILRFTPTSWNNGKRSVRLRMHLLRKHVLKTSFTCGMSNKSKSSQHYHFGMHFAMPILRVIRIWRGLETQKKVSSCGTSNVEKYIDLRFLIIVLNLITINTKHLYGHENAY